MNEQELAVLESILANRMSDYKSKEFGDLPVAGVGGSPIARFMHDQAKDIDVMEQNRGKFPEGHMYPWDSGS